MEQGRDALHWSPRLPKAQLERLYRQEAEGLYDEALLDEVGMALYMRCRDILTVRSARLDRRVRCPVCDRAQREVFIPRHGGLDEVIACPICGWEIVWDDYIRSVKRRQLNSGGAVEAFAAYLSRFEAAATPRSKMLAIDRLIHEFHYSLRDQPDLPTRPAGVNLIEGNLTSVVAFLNELSAGRPADPELRAARAAWEAELRAWTNLDWAQIMRDQRERMARAKSGDDDED